MAPSNPSQSDYRDPPTSLKDNYPRLPTPKHPVAEKTTRHKDLWDSLVVIDAVEQPSRDRLLHHLHSAVSSFFNASSAQDCALSLLADTTKELLQTTEDCLQTEEFPLKYFAARTSLHSFCDTHQLKHLRNLLDLVDRELGTKNTIAGSATIKFTRIALELKTSPSSLLNSKGFDCYCSNFLTEISVERKEVFWFEWFLPVVPQRTPTVIPNVGGQFDKLRKEVMPSSINENLNCENDIERIFVQTLGEACKEAFESVSEELLSEKAASVLDGSRFHNVHDSVGIVHVLQQHELKCWKVKFGEKSAEKIIPSRLLQLVQSVLHAYVASRLYQFREIVSAFETIEPCVCEWSPTGLSDQNERVAFESIAAYAKRVGNASWEEASNIILENIEDRKWLKFATAMTTKSTAVPVVVKNDTEIQVSGDILFMSNVLDLLPREIPSSMRVTVIGKKKIVYNQATTVKWPGVSVVVYAPTHDIRSDGPSTLFDLSGEDAPMPTPRLNSILSFCAKLMFGKSQSVSSADRSSVENRDAPSEEKTIKQKEHDGAPGLAGGNGGNFYIVGGTQQGARAFAEKIKLDAGKGSDGLDGRDGKPGQDGIQGANAPTTWRSVSVVGSNYNRKHCAFAQPGDRSTRGTRGEDGGRGGRAGDHGQSGKVSYLAISASAAMQPIKEGTCPASKAKNGKPGKGGKGGACPVDGSAFAHSFTDSRCTWNHKAFASTTFIADPNKMTDRVNSYCNASVGYSNAMPYTVEWMKNKWGIDENDAHMLSQKRQDELQGHTPTDLASNSQSFASHQSNLSKLDILRSVPDSVMTAATFVMDLNSVLDTLKSQLNERRISIEKRLATTTTHVATEVSPAKKKAKPSTTPSGLVNVSRWQLPAFTPSCRMSRSFTDLQDSIASCTTILDVLRRMKEVVGPWLYPEKEKDLILDYAACMCEEISFVLREFPPQTKEEMKDEHLSSLGNVTESLISRFEGRQRQQATRLRLGVRHWCWDVATRQKFKELISSGNSHEVLRIMHFEEAAVQSWGTVWFFPDSALIFSQQVKTMNRTVRTHCVLPEPVDIPKLPSHFFVADSPAISSRKARSPQEILDDPPGIGKYFSNFSTETCATGKDNVISFIRCQRLLGLENEENELSEVVRSSIQNAKRGRLDGIMNLELIVEELKKSTQWIQSVAKKRFEELIPQLALRKALQNEFLLLKWAPQEDKLKELLTGFTQLLHQLVYPHTIPGSTPEFASKFDLASIFDSEYTEALKKCNYPNSYVLPRDLVVSVSDNWDVAPTLQHFVTHSDTQMQILASNVIGDFDPLDWEWRARLYEDELVLTAAVGRPPIPAESAAFCSLNAVCRAVVMSSVDSFVKRDERGSWVHFWEDVRVFSLLDRQQLESNTRRLREEPQPEKDWRPVLARSALETSLRRTFSDSPDAIRRIVAALSVRLGNFNFDDVFYATLYCRLGAKCQRVRRWLRSLLVTRVVPTSLKLPSLKNVDEARPVQFEDCKACLDKAPYLSLTQRTIIVKRVRCLVKFLSDVRFGTDPPNLKNVDRTSTESILKYLCVMCVRLRKIKPRLNQLFAVVTLTVTSTALAMELLTGQGKTLVTTLFVSYQALRGKRVDVLSSSPDLAYRDSQDESDFISKVLDQPNCVGCNCVQESSYKDPSLSESKIRCHLAEEYKKPIVYGWRSSFIGDKLRARHLEDDVIGGRYANENGVVLFIDECDATLLDGANEVVYISHTIPAMKLLRIVYMFISVRVRSLNVNAKLPEDLRSEIDENVTVTRSCIESDLLDIPNSLKDFALKMVPSWFDAAVTAERICPGREIRKSKDNARFIVNELTGQDMASTVYSNGVQQFLDLRFADEWSPEPLHAVFMPLTSFVRSYKQQVYGVTGTLGEAISRDALKEFYSMECVEVPSVKSTQREVADPVVFSNSETTEWTRIVSNRAIQMSSRQPVLVICQDENHCHLVFEALNSKKMIKLMPFYTDDHSASIFSKPFQKGDIIVASNKGGRGADFKISEDLEKIGMHLISTPLFPNERVAAQAFGRVGRNGLPGTFECIVLLENDLSKEEHHLSHKDVLSLRRAAIATDEEHRICSLRTTLHQQWKEEEFFHEFEKNIAGNNFVPMYKSDACKLSLKKVLRSIARDRFATWLHCEKVRLSATENETFDHQSFSSVVKSVVFDTTESFDDQLKSFPKSATEANRIADVLMMYEYNRLAREVIEPQLGDDVTGWSSLAHCVCSIGHDRQAYADTRDKMYLARRKLRQFLDGAEEMLVFANQLAQWSSAAHESPENAPVVKQAEGHRNLLNQQILHIDRFVGALVLPTTFVDLSSFVDLKMSKDIFNTKLTWIYSENDARFTKACELLDHVVTEEQKQTIMQVPRGNHNKSPHIQLKDAISDEQMDTVYMALCDTGCVRPDRLVDEQSAHQVASDLLRSIRDSPLNEHERKGESMEASMCPLLEAGYLSPMHPRPADEEFYSNLHLNVVVNIKKRVNAFWGWIRWVAATIFAAAQIVAGACLAVASGGFMSKLGKWIAEQGISDASFLLSSALLGVEFSWGGFLKQKAVSIMMSLAAMGAKWLGEKLREGWNWMSKTSQNLSAAAKVTRNTAEKVATSAAQKVTETAATEATKRAATMSMIQASAKSVLTNTAITAGLHLTAEGLTKLLKRTMSEKLPFIINPCLDKMIDALNSIYGKASDAVVFLMDQVRHQLKVEATASSTSFTAVLNSFVRVFYSQVLSDATGIVVVCAAGVTRALNTVFNHEARAKIAQKLVNMMNFTAQQNEETLKSLPRTTRTIGQAKKELMDFIVDHCCRTSADEAAIELAPLISVTCSAVANKAAKALRVDIPRKIENQPFAKTKGTVVSQDNDNFSHLDVHFMWQDCNTTIQMQRSRAAIKEAIQKNALPKFELKMARIAYAAARASYELKAGRDSQTISKAINNLMAQLGFEAKILKMNHECCLLVFESERMCVVGCRGTAGLKDVVVDDLGIIGGLYGCLGERNMLPFSRSPVMSQYIAEATQAYPDYEVILSGHSLGGCVAEKVGAEHGLRSFNFNGPVISANALGTRVQLSSDAVSCIDYRHTNATVFKSKTRNIFAEHSLKNFEEHLQPSHSWWDQGSLSDLWGSVVGH